MKPNLSPEATALVEKVKQHILEEPRRLSMAITFENNPSQLHDYLDGYNSSIEKIPLNPPCGTVGCFAGWVMFLHAAQTNPGINPKNLCVINFEEKAANVLGLDHEEIEPVFYTFNWPKTYLERFSVPDLLERARAFVDRIQHWQDTGE